MATSYTATPTGNQLRQLNVVTSIFGGGGGSGGFGQTNVQAAHAALTKEQEESRKIIEALIEMLDEADMDFVINAATQRKYAKVQQYQTTYTQTVGQLNWPYQQYPALGPTPGAVTWKPTTIPNTLHPQTTGGAETALNPAQGNAQPQGISLWQALFGHP